MFIFIFKYYEVYFRATTSLDVSKFMYLLELVEPWQNYEGITFDEVKKSKHVVKTLIVSNVVRNQNLTLRMNYLWP